MPDFARDRERLERAMASIQEFQALASEYGIDDIFQDNGGKVLQSLIILGLRQLPGREGNDAVDDESREYELKTLNVLKQKQVTTHHHLNYDILAKYRKVAAWFISLYEGINLREIYRVETQALEPLFLDWERRIATSKSGSLNNPKIPLTIVADAITSSGALRMYPTSAVPGSQTLLDRVVGTRRRQLQRTLGASSSREHTQRETADGEAEA